MNVKKIARRARALERFTVRDRHVDESPNAYLEYLQRKELERKSLSKNYA